MLNGNHQNGNRNGNHAEIPPAEAQDFLWDTLAPSVTEKLAQPLDASLVSHRKGRGNRNFPYLEGRAAIDQANRVFGFGGWGYELVGDVILHELDNIHPGTGEVKRIRAYAATVRVNVPGSLSRTDVGFHTVAEETGEGHESAFKGAVTDALKRALRSYGDQFGNGLHGEESAGSDAGSGESLAPALRKTLLDLGIAQGFDEAQMRKAVKGKTGKDLDKLPAIEITQLVEKAARKLQGAGSENTPDAEEAETRQAA